MQRLLSRSQRHFSASSLRRRYGGYIGNILLTSRYCSAFGSTPDEALREVQIAKQAWLEAAMASGKPIPEPRYRPVIYQLAA